jgi:predicted N-formylglutamate amidohydrolase
MAASLLQPGDPPPFQAVNPDGRAPLLLVCDHASDAVPRALNGLGVAQREMQTHIAYDIGAAAVARILAARFDAPLLLSGYSRLVIDCNRAPGVATSIPPVSDAVPIPANQTLDEAARQARVAALFEPYHAAIDAQLDAFAARGAAPCFLAVHSCTPVFAGFRRPWHFGVLWNRDGRLAEPLIAALARDGEVCVGDNQPYSGRDGHGYTLPTHAESRGLPHATIEVRQDLIGTTAGIERWAQRLGDGVAAVLAPLTGWRA